MDYLKPGRRFRHRWGDGVRRGIVKAITIDEYGASARLYYDDVLFGVAVYGDRPAASLEPDDGSDERLRVEVVRVP